MIELRPHQNLALQMLRASLRAGNRTPVVAAPCAFGKTVLAASILRGLQDRGKRGAFFCDRIKLVDQTMEVFDRAGIHYGVVQGNHWLSNPNAPIQICSIQTVARRSRKPDYDLALVDECHSTSKEMRALIERYDMIPHIGLSATPYAKGMGQIWDDLIVPVTTEQLLDQGYLTPVHYYGGKRADLSKVKSRNIPTGGRDYDPNELAAAIENDKSLVGDIVQNWLAHGENRQTIAFCPSVKHSQGLVDMFNAAGIPARHIDGYTPDDERRRLYRDHDAGVFKILSCSRLLTVGYDSPTTSCLIDCFPTRSLIVYQQKAGRIMRLADGKRYAVYLDHAGNVARHGFAECIVPDELHDGESKYKERKLTKDKDETEKQERNCKQCGAIMIGIKCNACGHQLSFAEKLESDSSMLHRLDGSQKGFSKEMKSNWYSHLLAYSRSKGYSDGWAAHKYKTKFGVWPRGIDISYRPGPIPQDISNWLKSENIRNAKRREKYMA